MSLTRELAGFVKEVSFQDLPDEVIEKSKEMILNIVAVTLAGSSEETSQIITRYVSLAGGDGQSTVIAQGRRSSAANAALANGTMAHVLDFDENVQRRGNHPSNAIFPTVAAVGEMLGSSGLEVVESFAIGCEVSTKIGAAGDFEAAKPTMWRHGWHLEGVACTIGAAAAAAKLFGLNSDQVANAFAISASQASGVQANYGTSTKSLHSGMAAMNGVMAALLAKDGFTGAGDALESPVGFLGCYRRDADIDEEEFFARLANPFDVIFPGVGFKPFPCASVTHGSVSATLELVGESGIRHHQVDSVHVSCPARSGSRRRVITKPASGLESKFSIDYCVAVALVHGSPRMTHFTDEALRDEEVMEMVDLINVSFDEPVTDPESRPATVEVRLKDGSVLTKTVPFPKGHPRNPLSESELNDKFMYCSNEVLSSQAANRVVDMIRNLEQVRDVSDLMKQVS